MSNVYRVAPGTWVITRKPKARPTAITQGADTLISRAHAAQILSTARRLHRIHRIPNHS